MPLKFEVSATNLATSLEAIPEAVRERLKRGIAVLATLPATADARLRDAVTRAVVAEQPVNLAALANDLGLDRDAAGGLMTAATTLTVVITDQPVQNVADIIAVLRRLNLIEDVRYEPGLTHYVEWIVSERTNLRGGLRRKNLASAVLPSLIDSDFVVDVRLAFRKDAVADAVPVVIGHLDTDTKQELWFQMSGASLRQLLQSLKTAEERLSAAEAWIGRKSEAK